MPENCVTERNGMKITCTARIEIEVIRNNGAPDESLTVSPRLREGKYCFRNMRSGEEFVYEGGEITFRQAIRTVTLWEYRKI